MHAHVNIWPLNTMGASSNNASAREIGARLRKAPGFHSYMLIRTGEQEVVAITVFDSQVQLQAALDTVEDLVHQRVTPLAAGIPQRRRGEVLYHTQATNNEVHQSHGFRVDSESGFTYLRRDGPV